MSLSRPQQILLKRAQAEAGITDAEYRDTVELISALPGCRSSTDPRLTDRHLDNLLAYIEAIHWQRINTKEVQPSCKPDAIFRQRGYWLSKNRNESTSRDRYVERQLAIKIMAAEDSLVALGYRGEYLTAILEKTGPGPGYLAALRRTFSHKEKSHN